MSIFLRGATSLSMASILVGSVLTVASANAPGPSQDLIHARAKHFTVAGSLQVNDVLKVRRNMSVYGILYAHNSEQVWKGLLVRDGLKADVVNDSGPLQAQSATIANALQAGSITGASVTATGNADVGGTLAVAGKMSGNGVDAGPGGLATTGAVTAGSVNTNGQISGSSLTAAGNIGAGGTLTVQGATTLSGGTTITGNLNLTNASISGLSLSNLNLNGATVNSFNIGTPTGTAAPLNISANGRTANLGVNANGALTVDSLVTNNALTVGTSLAVNGAGGVTAATLQAPAASGGGQGVLTLQGGSIQLNGTVNIGNESDIILSQASGAASHILANGNTDVAGKSTVSVAAGAVPTGGYSVDVNYSKAYTNEPAVGLTPASDSNVGKSGPSKYWVTAKINSSGQYTGFTIHVYPPQDVPSSFNASYYYTVIGTGR
ncbi:MAG: hypothetical protein NVS4B2_00290 [Chloroflexota bacterium]